MCPSLLRFVDTLVYSMSQNLPLPWSLEALEDDFVEFLPETCRQLLGPSVAGSERPDCCEAIWQDAADWLRGLRRSAGNQTLGTQGWDKGQKCPGSFQLFQEKAYSTWEHAQSQATVAQFYTKFHCSCCSSSLFWGGNLCPNCRRSWSLWQILGVSLRLWGPWSNLISLGGTSDRWVAEEDSWGLKLGPSMVFGWQKSAAGGPNDQSAPRSCGSFSFSAVAGHPFLVDWQKNGSTKAIWMTTHPFLKPFSLMTQETIRNICSWLQMTVFLFGSCSPGHLQGQANATAAILKKAPVLVVSQSTMISFFNLFHPFLLRLDPRYWPTRMCQIWKRRWCSFPTVTVPKLRKRGFGGAVVTREDRAGHPCRAGSQEEPGKRQGEDVGLKQSID